MISAPNATSRGRSLLISPSPATPPRQPAKPLTASLQELGLSSGIVATVQLLERGGFGEGAGADVVREGNQRVSLVSVDVYGEFRLMSTVTKRAMAVSCLAISRQCFLGFRLGLAHAVLHTLTSPKSKRPPRTCTRCTIHPVACANSLRRTRSDPVPFLRSAFVLSLLGA